MKITLLIATIISLSLYTSQFKLLQNKAGDIINTDIYNSNAGSISLIQTSKEDNELLAEKESLNFTQDFEFSGPIIDLTSREIDQTIEGFGGAFTEASASVFYSMSEKNQEKFIEKYFDAEKGIGYSVGRIPVGACDFSPEESSKWSYADVAGDVNLEHFDMNATMDSKHVIPLIQRASQKIKETSKNVFKLFGSPWSPPAWMKTTRDMTHGGKLMKQYYSTMADYLVKWVTVFKSFGLNIWGLTPQNEPEGPWEFETCLYGPTEEAEWIGQHLGPKLKHAHPEVKIFPYDHNKDNLFEWTQTMYDHPEASKYVDGMAYHWYSGDDFDKVAESHKKNPNAILLGTEATWEGKNFPEEFNFKDGAWSLGEGYAHTVMGDLNAGANGWTDWNLLLNIKGGPNHVNNWCDAPMIADDNELYLHSQYYYLGHFSKYLLQGSKRVKHKVLNSKKYEGKRRNYGQCNEEDGLDATAFKRPDGKMAVVVLNCSDKSQEFKLMEINKSAYVYIPANSIQTLVYDLE